MLRAGVPVYERRDLRATVRLSVDLLLPDVRGVRGLSQGNVPSPRRTRQRRGTTTAEGIARSVRHAMEGKETLPLQALDRLSGTFCTSLRG